MGKPRGYGTVEACAVTGATYRQLDYWARSGTLVPSFASARGSGTRRSYSERDLRAIVALLRLAAVAPQVDRALRAEVATVARGANVGDLVMTDGVTIVTNLIADLGEWIAHRACAVIVIPITAVETAESESTP